jgi:hypothetical protein
MVSWNNRKFRRKRNYQLNVIKNLAEFCSLWQDKINNSGINQDKTYCEQNNYIIIELPEDKKISLDNLFIQITETDPKTVATYYGHSIKQKERKRKKNYN